MGCNVKLRREAMTYRLFERSVRWLVFVVLVDIMVRFGSLLLDFNFNSDSCPPPPTPSPTTTHNLWIHYDMNQRARVCPTVIRIGNEGDGGWWICDQISQPCIVYSFGV